MGFRVVVADCPWPFSDRLSMSDVKRGSAANYDTMSIPELKGVDVKSIAADDAVLALWCPSSLLKEGIEVMEAWGFKLKQTHVWVKTKKDPFKNILKCIKNIIKHGIQLEATDADKDVSNLHSSMNMNDMLAFGMGRLCRQTHEICLLGTRGKPYQYLNNKSQRSVYFAPGLKHSSKPEVLQDMLEKMFSGRKIELFARRDRPGWECFGSECPSSYGQDIRDSIKELKK